MSASPLTSEERVELLLLSCNRPRVWTVGEEIRYTTAIPKLLDALEAAEAQCAAMREALEQVEWEGGYAGDILTSAAWCPECGAERGDGHTASCSVGQALAVGAGATLLAKVARLEAFVAEVRIAQRADADGLDECAWNWIDAALIALDDGEVTG